MLTAITIQNFKGIGDPVTIPIRPLTIMFGKNSAGKSTVVQALHYAREVLMRNNPNADLTALGGSAIDLDGFRNFVHNRDLSRSITMRFEFTFQNKIYDEFPTYDEWDIERHYVNDSLNVKVNEEQLERMETGSQFVDYHQGRDLATIFEDILSGEMDFDRAPAEAKLNTAAVEFTVQWSETLENAIITSYRTWLGGEEAARIISSIDGRDRRAELNVHHWFFSCDESFPNLTGLEAWQRIPIPPGEYLGPLPSWERPVYLAPLSNLHEFNIGYLTVSQMLVAPGDMLVGYLQEPGLRDLRYLGPIRETPARNFRSTQFEDQAMWSDGHAAWNRLFSSDENLILEVNDWLGINGLKTGYTVEIDRYREIPLESNLMLALQNGTIFDSIDDTAEEVRRYPIRKRLSIVEEKSGLKLSAHDIGVGISQLIPVVVAALDSQGQFVAIEQPELHVHPAVQSELGDLFIYGSQALRNVFFIETHSEHLILRILRRIRETSEGEESVNIDPVFPENVSLIYVEPSANGNKILEIPITAEGDFETNVPGGFFAERAQELF